MRKLVTNAAIFLSAASILSSCASAINGTTQTIPVSSYPAGASVTLDGRPAGVTPTNIVVKRGKSHMVGLSKVGYQSQTIRLSRVMSPVVAGNLLIPGSIIGWGIDAATGAQYKMVPDNINTQLEAIN